MATTGKGSFLRSVVLDWLLGASAGTKPSSWNIALYTTSPNEAGGGIEVSGNGYVRQAYLNGSSQWTYTAPATMKNATGISFPTATGTGWGTIVAFALFSADNSQMYYFGPIAPQAIIAGDTPVFPAGGITVTED